MTSAKSNLTIHLIQPYLNAIDVDGVIRVEGGTNYEAPGILMEQLSFSDLHLDYFMNTQCELIKLNSGDNLTITVVGCYNLLGKSILRFSKRFTEHVSKLKEKGYELKKSKVHFIVYWTKVDTDNEIRIVLPEVEFVRNGG